MEKPRTVPAIGCTPLRAVQRPQCIAAWGVYWVSVHSFVISRELSGLFLVLRHSAIFSCCKHLPFCMARDLPQGYF